VSHAYEGDSVPMDDRRILSEPGFKHGVTNKTRGALFAAMRDYLEVDPKDKVSRIAFARAQGIMIHSFAQLTEGQARYLIGRVEDVGPINHVFLPVDADVLAELLDGYGGESPIIQQTKLRDDITRARFSAKMGAPSCV